MNADKFLRILLYEMLSEKVREIKSSASAVISKMNNAQNSRKIALRSQIFRTQMAIYKARRKGFSEVTLYLEGIVWYSETFDYFTKLGYNVMETNGGYIESAEQEISPAVTISWRDSNSDKKGCIVHFDTKSLYDCCNSIMDISDMFSGDDNDDLS